jgi:hypothetical protein
MGRLSISGDRTLLSAGHTTHGCDVVPAQQDRFPKEGGVPGSIASAAPSLVVLNAVQTEAVRFGDPGLVPLPKPGAVVLACATVAPDLARDVARRGEAAGLHKLDAPISAGGSAMKGQPAPRRCPHRRDSRGAHLRNDAGHRASRSFLEVASKCAGTSWMLEDRAAHRRGRLRPGQLGAPVAAALQQFLGSGLGRDDDSAVAKVYPAAPA